MNGASTTDPNAGHRARLRARLLDGGGEALLDHELVEYLLALVTPRGDTKPEAKRLLAEFGGLGPLLSADATALRRAGLSDLRAAALRIAHASALRLLETRISGQPVLASWQALSDYLQADMAWGGRERVRALFLNSKNVLIANEKMGEGSVDQAAVYVREVIRRALELHATALILVHNHPSGDPAPSREDIALTREIAEAGRRLGIQVHDHIIVGAAGQVSLRAQGLL